MKKSRERYYRLVKATDQIIGRFCMELHPEAKTFIEAISIQKKEIDDIINLKYENNIQVAVEDIEFSCLLQLAIDNYQRSEEEIV